MFYVMRNAFGWMFLFAISVCVIAGRDVYLDWEHRNNYPTPNQSRIAAPEYLSGAIVLLFATCLAWTILKVAQQKYPGIAEPETK